MRGAALAGLVLLLLGLTAPAGAAPQLEVTPDTDIDPAGQLVTVNGSGYDTSKGIYVAWCVVPPPGQLPSPCGGGADQQGQSESSVWISNNPPTYGVGLARPYGLNGTFQVEIRVTRYIGDDVDCYVTACAVTSRNDHTRSDDRSQDVFHPVSFRQEAAPTPASTAEPQPTAQPTSQPPTQTAAPSPAPQPPAPQPQPATSQATTPQPAATQPTAPAADTTAPPVAPTGDPTVEPTEAAAPTGPHATEPLTANTGPSSVEPSPTRPAGTTPVDPDSLALAGSSSTAEGRSGPILVATLLLSLVAGGLWTRRPTS